MFSIPQVTNPFIFLLTSPGSQLISDLSSFQRQTRDSLPVFLHFSNPAFPTDISTRPPQMHSLGKSFPPSPLWSCLRKCCLVPPPWPPCSDPHCISPTVFHDNLCPENTLFRSCTQDAFFHYLTRNFHLQWPIRMLKQITCNTSNTIESSKFSDVDLSFHPSSTCRITWGYTARKAKKKSNGIILNLEDALVKRSPDLSRLDTHFRLHSQVASLTDKLNTWTWCPQQSPSLMFASVLNVFNHLRPRIFPGPYLETSDQVFTRIYR